MKKSPFSFNFGRSVVLGRVDARRDGTTELQLAFHPSVVVPTKNVGCVVVSRLYGSSVRVADFGPRGRKKTHVILCAASADAF